MGKVSTRYSLKHMDPFSFKIKMNFNLNCVQYITNHQSKTVLASGGKVYMKLKYIMD